MASGVRPIYTSVNALYNLPIYLLTYPGFIVLCEYYVLIFFVFSVALHLQHIKTNSNYTVFHKKWHPFLSLIGQSSGDQFT